VRNRTPGPASRRASSRGGRSATINALPVALTQAVRTRKVRLRLSRASWARLEPELPVRAQDRRRFPRRPSRSAQEGSSPPAALIGACCRCDHCVRRNRHPIRATQGHRAGQRANAKEVPTRSGGSSLKWGEAPLAGGRPPYIGMVVFKYATQSLAYHRTLTVGSKKPLAAISAHIFLT